MRIPTSYRRQPLRINMTPMIDVVFLLIVFFLVSSHLVKQETQMPLALPKAESGPAAIDEQRERVVVNVLADGRILLAGQIVRREELENRLRSELERYRRGGRDDLEVRIRSDRSAPYAYIEPILLSCARAGIWNVTFAVYRKND